MMKYISAVIAWGVAFGAPQGFQRIEGDVAGPVLESGGSWVLKSGEKAIVQWDRFSIEHAERFRFEQTGPSAAILNRVVGGEISRIFGELSSNGRVYLLNPDGVLIGPHAQVETAGFVASSLDVLDQDFIQGKQQLLFADGGRGPVINFGVVHCESGDVALLARQVQNHGALKAPQGRVGLGVGAEILLQPKELPFIWIQTPIRAGVQRDGVSVEHTGAIEAIGVEMKASSNVYSMAIQSSGVIDALGIERKGGEVRLIAEQGTCSVNGRVTAGLEQQGSPTKGGFIEVSGGQVRLTGRLRAQNVLLDPTDIVISTDGNSNGSWNDCSFVPEGNASVINTATLQDLLAGCNVTISTASEFSGAQGGSITISNPVTWNAATTLTLLADAFIAINAELSNTSSTSGFTAMNFAASAMNATAGAYAGLQIHAPISATQGNLMFSGHGSSAGGVGALVGAAVSTAGSITFHDCVGGSAGSGNHGIHISGSGSLSGGQILLSGVGGSGAEGGHYGVNFEGTVSLSDANSSLQFLNCAGGSGGAQNIGLAINNSIRLTAGTINLNGIQGGSGTSNHYGVYIADGIRLSAPKILGMDIYGGAGNGSNIGFYINGGILGDLNLSNQFINVSTSSHGKGDHEIGMKLDQPTSNRGTLESGDGGNITLDIIGGRATDADTPSGGFNYGIHLAGAAFNLGQNHPATITIRAEGGDGTEGCHGVCIDTADVVLNIGATGGGLYFSTCKGGNTSSSGSHGFHLEKNLITNRGILNFSSIFGGYGSTNNHGMFIGSGAQISAPVMSFDSISSGQGTGSDIGFYVAGGTVGSSSDDINVTITSGSASQGSGGVGVQLDQGGKILTGSGSGRISINGYGSNSGLSGHGVVVTDSGSAITSVNNSINISGLGYQGYGIQVAPNTTVGATGSGGVFLNGISQGGVADGVAILGPTASVNSAEGSLTIYGTTSSTAPTSAGIHITSSTDPFTVSGMKGVIFKSQKTLLEKTKIVSGEGIIKINGNLVTNP